MIPMPFQMQLMDFLIILLKKYRFVALNKNNYPNQKHKEKLLLKLAPYQWRDKWEGHIDLAQDEGGEIYSTVAMDVQPR